MLEETTAPAPQAPRRLPGDLDVWIFVMGDLLFFAAYFVIFMVYRAQGTAQFVASQQHLSLLAGALNTVVLLTSSRFVALGVQAARAGEHRRASRLISGGAVCGVAFVLIKAFEWWSEISQGFTLTRNNFFMFYYMLTSVHLFHVLLGLVFLGIVLRELRAPDRCRTWLVESGAIFWHMVDLLWIVIFVLLYLMR
jgi:nitric oxide reductase NorE protein